MISLNLLIALAIGTIAMWIPMSVLTTWYKVKIWKSIPTAVLLTVAGTAGTYLWYFLENHGVGRSFYGAVFVVPVVFPLIAMLFHIPYGELMDLCAPAECVMLAIMKIQCLIDGCCGGRVLFTTAEGVGVCFPSQLVEMLNALLIFAVLMLLSRRKANRGSIYPWYMLIYGVTRFVLNFFRENQSGFLFGIPPGHIWSIGSILAGVAVLLAIRRKKHNQKMMERDYV